MKSALLAPTVAEERRFDWIQQVGCIICLINGYPQTPCDIHHLLSGGRRISHSHTIGLCPSHHRGVNGVVSIDSGSKRFAETYGVTEQQLLEIQDEVIAAYEKRVSIIPAALER